MKSSLAIAVMGLLALSLSACTGPAPAKASSTPAESAQLVIAVATAREHDLTRTAQTQGTLFPKEQAVVAAEVSGAVTEVLADLGDQVKPGQVLLRIDDREYQLRMDSAQAQLAQVQARLANAQANFDRSKALNEAQLISTQEFDRSSAELRVAQADTDAAGKQLGLMRKKLGDTYIRAPFAGSVQKRMVSLGEHVAEGMALYELIATDPIKLRAQIPERFVPLATVGLGLDLTVDARAGQTFHGKITRIAPALDENSRTLLVEAEVPNSDGQLKPGYFAHVTLNLGHDRALFIPQSAVLRYAGVARIFVLESGVVKSREVVTGATDGDQVEVISGLKAGERVAISDVDRLSDGTAVVAKEPS